MSHHKPQRVMFPPPQLNDLAGGKVIIFILCYFLFIYFETEQRLKFESIDGYIHQMMSSGFHE